MSKSQHKPNYRHIDLTSNANTRKQNHFFQINIQNITVIRQNCRLEKNFIQNRHKHDIGRIHSIFLASRLHIDFQSQIVRNTKDC